MPVTTARRARSELATNLTSADAHCGRLGGLYPCARGANVRVHRCATALPGFPSLEIDEIRCIKRGRRAVWAVSREQAQAVMSGANRRDERRLFFCPHDATIPLMHGISSSQAPWIGSPRTGRWVRPSLPSNSIRSSGRPTARPSRRFHERGRTARWSSVSATQSSASGCIAAGRSATSNERRACISPRSRGWRSGKSRGLSTRRVYAVLRVLHADEHRVHTGSTGPAADRARADALGRSAGSVPAVPPSAAALSRRRSA